MSQQQNPFLVEEADEPILLRMALSGPPGGGKTYSAMSIATELAAGPIMVIDSERGSSRRYKKPRGLFEFKSVQLEGDFSPRHYVDLIRDAAAAGAGVLIVDSLSHAWEGVLDAVNQFGGQFQHWNKVKPLERELFDALLNFPGHVIVTLRTKNVYEDVEGKNGKMQKQKVGLGAVQREGVEYEFDVVIRMENARGNVEKSRCSELADKSFDRPGANVVKILKPWLGSPKAPPAAAPSIAQLVDERAKLTATLEVLIGKAPPDDALKAREWLAKADRTAASLGAAIGRLQGKIAKTPSPRMAAGTGAEAGSPPPNNQPASLVPAAASSVVSAPAPGSVAAAMGVQPGDGPLAPAEDAQPVVNMATGEITSWVEPGPGDQW